MSSSNDISSSDGDYRGFERLKSDGVIGQQILARAHGVNVSRVYLCDVAASCSVSDDSLPQFSRVINEFPNEPYVIIKAIPVTVQRNAPREYIASFREANIAMPGETVEEAYGNLTTHILDVYEILKEEPPTKLARGPREQLAILRKFVAKKIDVDKEARNKNRKKTIRRSGS